jgi:hypothetical protein
LSTKRVRELIVINKLLLANMVYQINLLQGADLTTFSLSFMDILGSAWVLSITTHYIHFRSPDARTVAKD